MWYNKLVPLLLKVYPLLGQYPLHKNTHDIFLLELRAKHLSQVSNKSTSIYETVEIM